MTTFWVYINEPNDKALVHLASCSHCNDGKGRGVPRLDQNGKWIGPLDLETAIQTARSSGKKKRAWCGFCAKTLDIEPAI